MRGYGLGRKPTSKPSLGHFSVGQLWEEMSCAQRGTSLGESGSEGLSRGKEEATAPGRFLRVTAGSRAEGRVAMVARRKRFHRYAERFLYGLFS